MAKKIGRPSGNPDCADSGLLRVAPGDRACFSDGCEAPKPASRTACWKLETSLFKSAHPTPRTHFSMEFPRSFRWVTSEQSSGRRVAGKPLFSSSSRALPRVRRRERFFGKIATSKRRTSRPPRSPTCLSLALGTKNSPCASALSLLSSCACARPNARTPAWRWIPCSRRSACVNSATNP